MILKPLSSVILGFVWIVPVLYYPFTNIGRIYVIHPYRVVIVIFVVTLNFYDIGRQFYATW